MYPSFKTSRRSVFITFPIWASYDQDIEICIRHPDMGAIGAAPKAVTGTQEHEDKPCRSRAVGNSQNCTCTLYGRVYISQGVTCQAKPMRHWLFHSLLIFTLDWGYRCGVWRPFRLGARPSPRWCVSWRPLRRGHDHGHFANNYYTSCGQISHSRNCIRSLMWQYTKQSTMLQNFLDACSEVSTRHVTQHSTLVMA